MQIIINLLIKVIKEFVLKKNPYKLLIRMCDMILEFLYSSINANFNILIYHLTDLSTYIENWIFYLFFVMILSDLLLFKSFVADTAFPVQVVDIVG